MAPTEEDVYCRNCSELLFRLVHSDDGTTHMTEFAPDPESDGVQKYYLCPTCGGKNLVMLIDDPPGNHYYEIAGFIRS